MVTLTHGISQIVIQFWWIGPKVLLRKGKEHVLECFSISYFFRVKIKKKWSTYPTVEYIQWRKHKLVKLKLFHFTSQFQKIWLLCLKDFSGIFNLLAYLLIFLLDEILMGRLIQNILQWNKNDIKSSQTTNGDYSEF